MNTEQLLTGAMDGSRQSGLSEAGCESATRMPPGRTPATGPPMLEFTEL
jgi:hypothetical protein